MGSSYSLVKDVGPVYFNAMGPAPKLAYHIFDKYINEKTSIDDRKALLSVFPPSLTIDLPPGDKYRIPSSKGYIIELILTDPGCVMTANQDKIVLGVGTFTFIRHLMFCCDLFIEHSGPFEIKFYDLEDKYLEMLGCLDYINFYLPGADGEKQLWGYGGGTMGKNTSKSPLRVTLGVSYDSIYEKVDTTSGYVYSTEIETLQKHPKMFEMREEWGLSWDEDLIRQSYPPCICVSVKVNKLGEFFDFAEEVCPDMKTTGFDKYDSKEVPQDPKEISRQEQNNLAKLEKRFEELLESGLVYR